MSSFGKSGTPPSLDSEVIERFVIPLKSGEGGLELPGVDSPSGEGALEPGRERRWKPNGEPGAVEGGESSS
jgi:hypothetical protein